MNYEQIVTTNGRIKEEHVDYNLTKQNAYLMHEKPMRTLVLAACWHYDEWFLNEGMNFIKHSYFNTDEEQAFFKFLHHYATEYGQVPSKADVEYEFNKSGGKYDKDLMADMLIEIGDLIAANKLEYGKKQAIDFARYQAESNAFMMAATLQKQGKPFTDAWELLDEAQQIGMTSVEWRTPAEVDSYSFDLKWLIDGMIKQGKVNLFYGESGCGKTWLILYKVARMILGKSFMGHKTTKSAVIWIDEENREDEMMERLYSLRAAMTNEERVEFDANFTFRTLGKTCTSRFNLNDATAVRRLVKQIKKTTDRPVVVVFDSMGAVSYSDENTISDNKSAIKIMNILADITIQTDATIEAIHHPTKEKSNMFGGVFMTNLVDLNVEVSKVSIGKQDDNDEEDKSRLILKLESKKDRKGVFSEGIEVEFITDGNDELGRAINPKFVVPDDIGIYRLKKNKRNEQAKHLDAIDWIHQQPDKLLGMSMRNIYTNIKLLAEQDEVSVYKAGWEKAVRHLVEQQIYCWNTDKARSSNKALEKGSKYDEFAKLIAT